MSDEPAVVRCGLCLARVKCPDGINQCRLCGPTRVKGTVSLRETSQSLALDSAGSAAAWGGYDSGKNVAFPEPASAPGPQRAERCRPEFASSLVGPISALGLGCPSAWHPHKVAGGRAPDFSQNARVGTGVPDRFFTPLPPAGRSGNLPRLEHQRAGEGHAPGRECGPGGGLCPGQVCRFSSCGDGICTNSGF